MLPQVHQPGNCIFFSVIIVLDVTTCPCYIKHECCCHSSCLGMHCPAQIPEGDWRMCTCLIPSSADYTNCIKWLNHLLMNMWDILCMATCSDGPFQHYNFNGFSRVLFCTMSLNNNGRGHQILYTKIHALWNLSVSMANVCPDIKAFVLLTEYKGQ